MARKRPARTRGARERGRARRLAVQALYQRELTGHCARDLIAQFAADEQMPNADEPYFRELLMGVEDCESGLNELIDAHADRPVAQLDPVEHAVLLIGTYELRQRLEIPYRVVVNEAIDLTHRFGGEGSHKFINAVLDRIARKLRQPEISGVEAG